MSTLPSAAPAAAAHKPGDGYVQAFARGLDVIRSFGRDAARQTLAEVAQRTGLSRASARRVLLTLETLGYVRLDGRQFELTPRILDLGFAYLSSQPLWQIAEPIVEHLVQAVKESSSMAVLDRGDILYTLRVPTQKIMSINLAIGSRLPAHCTSMGRVLLAGLDAHAVAEHLRAVPLERRTPRTVTDPAKLRAILDDVRRHGWALVNQELEEGLVSIAAPVIDRQGRWVAALNVSGQVNRTTPKQMRERYLPPLREAAQRISRLLGS